MKKITISIIAILLAAACSKSSKNNPTPITEFTLQAGSWVQIDTNNNPNIYGGYYYTDSTMTITHVGDSLSFYHFPNLYTDFKLKKTAGTEILGSTKVENLPSSIKTINRVTIQRMSERKFYFEYEENWSTGGPYKHHGVCIKQ